MRRSKDLWCKIEYDPIIHPKRVLFPMFTITSNPTIPLDEIKERRFDLIQRTQNLVKEEIIEKKTRGKKTKWQQNKRKKNG
jgi:hypothetical protein